MKNIYTHLVFKSKLIVWLKMRAAPKYMLLGEVAECDIKAGKYAVKQVLIALSGVVGAGIVFIFFGANAGIGIFSLLLPIALILALENDIDRKIKERRRELELDFPVFLNKLSLLVGAGLTVRASINRIINTRKKAGLSSSCLYKEIELLTENMDVGFSEAKALEKFARRCGTPEANILATLIIQNMRTGGTKMSVLLRMLSVSAWQSRISAARKAGEEASEKLFLPLAIVFIAILVLLSAPALMHMSVI